MIHNLFFFFTKSIRSILHVSTCPMFVHNNRGRGHMAGEFVWTLSRGVTRRAVTCALEWHNARTEGGEKIRVADPYPCSAAAHVFRDRNDIYKLIHAHAQIGITLYPVYGNLPGAGHAARYTGAVHRESHSPSAAVAAAAAAATAGRKYARAFFTSSSSFFVVFFASTTSWKDNNIIRRPVGGTNDLAPAATFYADPTRSI